MKTTLKILILQIVMVGATGSFAQSYTTHYGTYAGQNGDYNSNFGYATGGGDGNRCTFFGEETGFDVDGNYNTFFKVGFGDNSTGTYNCFMGRIAGAGNTTGSYNTFMGAWAGEENETGSYNTAIGVIAGPNSTNLSNTTAIGELTTTTASNQVRIGHSSISSIGGYVGWSNLSDQRFKKDISYDIPGVEFIRLLKPKSYYIDFEKLNTHISRHIAEELKTKFYKHLPTQEREVGLMAQDVESVLIANNWNMDLVNPATNDNDYYSINYSKLTVPLIKAIHEINERNIQLHSQMSYQKLMVSRLLSDDMSDQQTYDEHSSQINLNHFIDSTNSNLENVEIILYDKTGNQLKRLDFSKNTKMDLSELDLPIGKYTAIVLYGNSTIETFSLKTF